MLLPPGSGIRVGVSGTRFLNEEARAGVADLSGEAFGILAAACHCITYCQGPVESPQLRCLTSLAEGSDRVMAGAALTQGFSLHAVLPFPADEFALDFPETRDEFDRLLARAGDNVLVIDGDRQERRTDSYEAATRWLLGNTDILLAAWDGHAAYNRGGTAHAVWIALSRSIPVLWLPTTGGDPRFLRSLADLHKIGKSVAVVHGWRNDLRAWVGIALAPPMQMSLRASWLGRLALRCSKRDGAPPKSSLWDLQWKLERRILGKASQPTKSVGNGSKAFDATLDALPQSEWKLLRDRPHQFAMGYSRGYRTTFVLAVALGGLALVTAFLALAIPALKLTMTVVELLCLLGIWLLIDQVEAEGWHQRFVVARSVAERSRLPEFRSVVGLPTERGLARVSDGGAPDPASWILGAWARWLKLPNGSLRGEKVSDVHEKILRKVVQGQVDYLDGAFRKNYVIDHRIEACALWFFKITLCLLVAKVVLICAHAPYMVITVATVALAFLPALSAVLFGLRAYAEYGLQSRRYAHTRDELKRIAEDLETLPLQHPLASQAVAWFAERVTEVLHNDVEQWSDLTSSKILSKEA